MPYYALIHRVLHISCTAARGVSAVHKWVRVFRLARCPDQLDDPDPDAVMFRYAGIDWLPLGLSQVIIDRQVHIAIDPSTATAATAAKPVHNRPQSVRYLLNKRCEQLPEMAALTTVDLGDAPFEAEEDFSVDSAGTSDGDMISEEPSESIELESDTNSVASDAEVDDDMSDSDGSEDEEDAV